MTQTSSFGVSKREKHDSSMFYNRNLYYKFFHKPATKKELNIEVPEPGEWVDQIYDYSSTNMEIIPANSIALALASPSYNTGMDIDEYLYLIQKIGKELYRVLRPGGRYIINIANLARESFLLIMWYGARMIATRCCDVLHDTPYKTTADNWKERIAFQLYKLTDIRFVPKSVVATKSGTRMW